MRQFNVGDLIRITSEGAHNIDIEGIWIGSVGIIVSMIDDHEDTGWVYTVVVNNERIPYLYDHEIEKFE